VHRQELRGSLSNVSPELKKTCYINSIYFGLLVHFEEYNLYWEIRRLNWDSLRSFEKLWLVTKLMSRKRWRRRGGPSSLSGIVEISSQSPLVPLLILSTEHLCQVAHSGVPKSGLQLSIRFPRLSFYSSFLFHRVRVSSWNIYRPPPTQNNQR
jgi:hypothetical protein